MVHRGVRMAYGDTVASCITNAQFLPHRKNTASAFRKTNGTAPHVETQVIDSSENYMKHINTRRENYRRYTQFSLGFRGLNSDRTRAPKYQLLLR